MYVELLMHVTTVPFRQDQLLDNPAQLMRLYVG